MQSLQLQWICHNNYNVQISINIAMSDHTPIIIPIWLSKRLWLSSYRLKYCELQRNYWTATERADHVAEPNCKPEEVTHFHLNLTLLPLAQILPVLFFMTMTESKHWVIANIHTTETNNVMTIVNYAVVVFSWLSVSLSVSLSLLLDGLLFFCEDSLLPLGLFTPFFPSTSGSFSITWSKARGIQARWRVKKCHNKQSCFIIVGWSSTLPHCYIQVCDDTPTMHVALAAGSLLLLINPCCTMQCPYITAVDSLPYAVCPPWVSGYLLSDICVTPFWNHKDEFLLSKQPGFSSSCSCFSIPPTCYFLTGSSQSSFTKTSTTNPVLVTCCESYQPDEG